MNNPFDSWAVVIFVIIAIGAVSSLLGAVFVKASCRVALNINPPYGMALKAAAIATASCLPLSVLNAAPAGHPVQIVGLVAAFLICSFVLGKVVKRQEDKAIGFGSGAAVAAGWAVMGGVVLVVATLIIFLASQMFGSRPGKQNSQYEQLQSSTQQKKSGPFDDLVPNANASAPKGSFSYEEAIGETPKPSNTGMDLTYDPNYKKESPWQADDSSDNYATCILKNVPGLQNDTAAMAARKLCIDQHPRGIDGVARGSGKGLFGFNSGAECAVKKAGDSRSQVAGNLIYAACRALFDEPEKKPWEEYQKKPGPFDNLVPSANANPQPPTAAPGKGNEIDLFEQKRMESVAMDGVRKFPELDSSSPNRNQGAIDEIVRIRDVYIGQGANPADALQKAIDEFAKYKEEQRRLATKQVASNVMGADDARRLQELMRGEKKSRKEQTGCVIYSSMTDEEMARCR